jgi:endonuclease-3
MGKASAARLGEDPMTDTSNGAKRTQTPEEPKALALEVHERLVGEYGEPIWDNQKEKDPVGELVNTILSQNTNDHNRDIAYNRLRERFPNWQEVRDAPTQALIEAVRPAGLAPTKAPRIQEALATITEHQGKISLAFLRDMPLEEARQWLLGLNGVGPKTAAIVLLFSLGRPAFPVDTHVHRVTRRLGLIPPSTSREKAHELIEKHVPETHYYPFHLNLIRHGREVCSARSPQCDLCVLQDICAYYHDQATEA